MEANDIAWAIDAGIRSGFADVIPDLSKVLRENNNATARIAELEAQIDSVVKRAEQLERGCVVAQGTIRKLEIELATANGMLDEVAELTDETRNSTHETDVEWMILEDILAKRKGSK